MKAIEFRRILCPINFADGSQRTVESASMLARLHDAELRLLHVVGNDSSSYDAEGLIASLFALTRTLPERTRISAALAHGDPSSEIIQHARIMGADLVVLGSERRSAPAAVRRSIAGEVATNGGCPILHVRPSLLPTLSDRSPGFTEIMCCVDPASSAGSPDDYAHAFVLGENARVTLLNVVASGEEMSGSTPAGAADFIRRRSVVNVSLTGQPGPEIVALAHQTSADLVVVGAQDDPFGHALGSTAAHIVVHAPCSVLIVPRASIAFHIASNDVGAKERATIAK